MTAKSDQRRIEREITQKAKKPDRDVCVCVYPISFLTCRELTVLARRYVRGKRQILKMEKMVDKIAQFIIMLSEVRVNNQIASQFERLAKCIVMINKEIDPVRMDSIIKLYETQTTAMELNEEAMNEESMLHIHTCLLAFSVY